MLLPGARHAPHREAPDATLAAMVEFVDRILKFHHEGDMESAA
jgi:hypothetical protein